MEYTALSEYQVNVLNTVANSGGKEFLAPDPTLFEEKETEKREKLGNNLTELKQLCEYGFIENISEKAIKDEEAKGKVHAFSITDIGLKMFQNSESRLVN